MMILNEFGVLGSRGPLWRAQTFALEQLISFNCVTGDIRWSIIALMARSFTAMWVIGQAQFGSLVRDLASRGGTRLAANSTDADSTVAAGGT
jgi:hypothetical protein